MTRRLPTSRTPTALGLLVVVALWSSGACSEEVGEVLPCGETLEDALVNAGLLELDPGDPTAPRFYRDDTLAGRDGGVVDPTPLSRGEHIVSRYWRDSETCELEGGLYSWSPPPPRTAGAPQGQTSLLTGFANPRVHTLVVTGTDAGSREDYDAWRGAMEAVGAVGLTLFEPTRGEAEAALATVCESLTYDHSLVLVTTGRASPAGGGALHLRGEAWSYERIALLLGFHCAGARTRTWVVDSAWLQDLSELPITALPTQIWHASDAHHPDAPRVTPHGGGLLTAALTAHISERSASLCLDTRGAEPEELAWVFDDSAAVLARMKDLRWQATGLDVLRNEGHDIATLPAVRHRAIDRFLDDLPSTLVSDFGTPEVGYPCLDNDPCETLISGCTGEACETWRCVEGRCRPSPATGRPCDDGTACTLADTCDAIGLCTGQWVPCADGDPCTTDTCNWDTGCAYVDKAEGEPCSDSDACTKGDACDAIGLCVGEDRDCEDGDPCTADSCDIDEGCVHNHATAPCDDLNPCTHQDYCHSGVCIGQPLPCYDQNPCTLDTCDPKAGCAFIPTANGVSCDDDDACTTDERCESGLCVGEQPDCDDGLECTLDYCEAGDCLHLPPPGHCATAVGCTLVGEHPADAPCQICVATDVLETDPAQDGVLCEEDGLACTVDACVGGACTHGPEPGTCLTPDGSCVDVGEEVAPCLVCADTGVAIASSTGASCEDTNPCTSGDLCTDSGLCVGEPVPCCAGDAALACGETVTGQTSPPGVPSMVDVWPCYASFSMGGPETLFRFTAPCSGTFAFHYDGPAGSLLFSMKDEEGLSAQDACLQGECQTYSPGNAIVDLAEGESVLLAIDSWSDEGAPGGFELETTCGCTP